MFSFVVRQKFTIRLKSYEEELKRIDREFNVARENVQQIQSRNQLLGAATIDIGESGNTNFNNNILNNNLFSSLNTTKL